MKKFTAYYAQTIAALSLVCSASVYAEPAIIINEDNSHFFTTRTAEQMSLEGLHAFIDQYADTEVSHLVLSTNSMKSSFASTSREAIWELGEQTMPEGDGKLWMDNARLLHERGLDPYALWIERAREKNIEPWLSMRMNDLHEVPDVKSYMHSTFWLNHPEMWRVPNDTGGGYSSRALDFGHPEVRKYAMDFVRELLERYDPDGLELDWMRFGWHFKAGEEAEGAVLLTEFMREVRQLTEEWSKKRGHVIKLGARVPAHPDAAKGLGMDGVQWAQEGLIDMLVPCPFWTTSDFDIPVELWKERIGEQAKHIVIAPGLEFSTRAYPGADPIANDLATTRGFAASAWYRGADQIYLFNYMDSQTRPVSAKDYRVLVEEGLGKEVVTSQPRRIIQAFRDTVPPGFDAGVKLPAVIGDNTTFILNIGKKPKSGNVMFKAGLAQGEGLEDAVLGVMINGVPCEMAGENATLFPGAKRSVQFRCPLKAVKHGANTIQLLQPTGPAQKVVWAEIMIDPN